MLFAFETAKPLSVLRFQSMLLLFLPPGATILEVFPYKYWKEGYAPLAEEWGVRHELIMSRPVSWAKRLALFFVPLVRRREEGGGEGRRRRGRKKNWAHSLRERRVGGGRGVDARGVSRVVLYRAAPLVSMWLFCSLSSLNDCGGGVVVLRCTMVCCTTSLDLSCAQMTSTE